jgi:hypothetical protein
VAGQEVAGQEVAGQVLVPPLLNLLTLLYQVQILKQQLGLCLGLGLCHDLCRHGPCLDLSSSS